MKLAVALLMLADLLVRGAAVPHVHAADASDHDQSLRPHVHVTWHPESHGHSHNERREDVHHGETVQAHIDHHSHATPDHDTTAIYLDGCVMMFTAADQSEVARPLVSWITPSTDGCSAVSADAACMRGAARPPGERTHSIHDLLPHVLRI